MTFALKGALGTVITIWSCPSLAMPCRVKGCEMVICSGYTPGHTWIVEPGGTLATASEIVEKLVSLGLQVPTAKLAAIAGNEARSGTVANSNALRRNIGTPSIGSGQVESKATPRKPRVEGGSEVLESNSRPEGR